MNLTIKGYSVLEVAEDRAILFSPEDVRSPITGAYRGKRRVASFDPRAFTENQIDEIAECDYIVRNYPELGADYFGEGTDKYARGQLAHVFTTGDTV